MSNDSDSQINGSSLDNTRLSRHHLKIWFLSAMGVFMDGFDLFIIAVALPLIQHQWQIGAAEAGLIAAAAPLGAIFGAGVFGRFTDKMGRRTMLILSVMFFVVFTSLSAFAWSPLSLMGISFSTWAWNWRRLSNRLNLCFRDNAFTYAWQNDGCKF